jgi:hypothetical protein
MPRVPVAVVVLVLAAVAFGAGSARADEIQRSGPESWPSKHDLSAHIGFQAGFGATLGSTSGFKVEAEYAYRFHPLAWFMVQVANDFGFGNADGVCFNSNSLTLQCYRGGWDFELMAGFKLKWVTPIPLVVEAPVLVGVDLLYNRNCNDDGASVPVIKTGAGVKYFVTRKIGVGAKIDFAGGPGFHQASGCGMLKSYTDYFGYFDFMVGAEFMLGS